MSFQGIRTHWHDPHAATVCVTRGHVCCTVTGSWGNRLGLRLFSHRQTFSFLWWVFSSQLPACNSGHATCVLSSGLSSPWIWPKSKAFFIELLLHSSLKSELQCWRVSGLCWAQSKAKGLSESDLMCKSTAGYKDETLLGISWMGETRTLSLREWGKKWWKRSLWVLYLNYYVLNTRILLH